MNEPSELTQNNDEMPSLIQIVDPNDDMPHFVNPSMTEAEREEVDPTIPNITELNQLLETYTISLTDFTKNDIRTMNNAITIYKQGTSLGYTKCSVPLNKKMIGYMKTLGYRFELNEPLDAVYTTYLEQVVMINS